MNPHEQFLTAAPPSAKSTLKSDENPQRATVHISADESETPPSAARHAPNSLGQRSHVTRARAPSNKTHAFTIDSKGIVRVNQRNKNP